MDIELRRPCSLREYVPGATGVHGVNGILGKPPGDMGDSLGIAYRRMMALQTCTSCCTDSLASCPICVQAADEILQGLLLSLQGDLESGIFRQ
jgi:hypothetical protein